MGTYLMGHFKITYSSLSFARDFGRHNTRVFLKISFELREKCKHPWARALETKRQKD